MLSVLPTINKISKRQKKSHSASYLILPATGDSTAALRHQLTLGVPCSVSLRADTATQGWFFAWIRPPSTPSHRDESNPLPCPRNVQMREAFHT